MIAVGRRSLLAPVTSGNAFGAGAYSPAAFTVTLGRPVIVVAHAMSQANDALTGSDLTISDTDSNVWTSIQLTTTHPNWGYGSRAWGMMPKATGSITVSVDAGAFAIENYRVMADELLGVSRIRVGATAVGNDTDGDGAASITLSANSTPGSLVYAFENLANGTGAAGTVSHDLEWNKFEEFSRTDWLIFEGQTRRGGFGTAVPWLDLSVGGIPEGAALMAFEILPEFQGRPIDWRRQYDWKPQRWDFPLGVDLLLDDYLPTPGGGGGGGFKPAWARNANFVHQPGRA